jgi:hypothetical protein
MVSDARHHGEGEHDEANMAMQAVPGAAAASARIQPVLRRSSPSRPSRNNPAEAATRSCVNNGRISALTARSEDAQSSSVASIDNPVIHDLLIMVNHGFRDRKNMQL